MAQQAQSYITLDSIITDYMNEAELSISKYAKIYHLAYRGMENLGLDFFYRIQTVKLPVNANMTVNLPPDYLQWTKVGILNATGGIIPLYYNPNLTTFADLWSNRLENINDTQSLALEWNNGTTWCNWWNGSGYTNIYGVPSGEPFVGSFKIDTENNVLILNETFTRDYIMIEYVSSPNPDKDYYVPIQFRDAMIAWLWWKDGKAKPINGHAKLGAVRDAKHEFDNERRNAIARWKPFRIEEAYQASQEQSRLAIKT